MPLSLVPDRQLPSPCQNALDINQSTMPSPTPIFNPTPTKPPTQSLRSGPTGHLCVRPLTSSIPPTDPLAQLIRDALPLHLWLALGGLAALLARLLIGAWALLLAGLWVALCVADALFLDAWLRPVHPHMQGVLSGRVAGELPDERGRFESGSPGKSVVVFIVGARCNQLRSPPSFWRGCLTCPQSDGVVRPGVQRSRRDYAQNATRAGRRGGAVRYAGVQSLGGYGAGLRKQHLLHNVFHFPKVCLPSKSMAVLTVSRGLKDFAHSELHKEAYMWWAKNGDKYPYIHMWQETYVSPPGHWRSSHTNGAPTLLRE